MPHTPGIDIQLRFAPQPTAHFSRNLLGLIYSPWRSLHSVNNVNRSTLCRHLILFLWKCGIQMQYIQTYIHTLAILLYYSPDILTKLRSSNTNNNSLGALATKFGFYKEMKNFQPLLENAVTSFSEIQNQNGRRLPNHVFERKSRFKSFISVHHPPVIENQ